MYRKSFLRNATLVSGLIISAVILSAQVTQTDKNNADHKTDTVAINNQLADTIPPVDNTEGLAELNKIIGRYDGDNLFLSGEINFYENADSVSVPQEKTTFTSITTPEVSSYELDSIQTIVQEGVTLLVDKKEKSIAIAEQNPELKADPVKQDVATELKQFIDYIYSVKVETKGDEKKLVITFKEDAPVNVNKYEILYDAGNYRIKRVRMEIADGDITEGSTEEQNEDDELVLVDSANNEIPTGHYAIVKMSIYEIVYKSERKAEAELIDMKRFIKKDADGYVPTGAFKNYEILN